MAQRSIIPDKIQGVLRELFDIIDTLFVSYFAVINSIKLFRLESLSKFKKNLEEDAIFLNKDFTQMSLSPCHIGDYDGTESIVYQTTPKQIINIFDDPGYLENLQACNLVVIIYQYWEDTYRAKIAKILEKEKNDVKGNIWNDLRLIRHSILHCKFVAHEDIKKCDKIRSFIAGQPIKFENLIVDTIKIELHNWHDDYIYNCIQKYTVEPNKNK